MASATPPNGASSPRKPGNGRARVPVAIPLHYPNHRRGNSKAVTHETSTPTKSEKSDNGSGDERLALRGGGLTPMTPESLSSSIHKPSESRDETSAVPATVVDQIADKVNGLDTHDTVSMPPLEPQLTLRADSVQHQADVEGGAMRANGDAGHADTSKENAIKGKPRSNSKPLRVLQASPPEFHPSQPSSTPMSANPSQMAHPFYYPGPIQGQSNGYNAYAPQMPPRPQSMSFDSDAHVHPYEQHAPRMSRTPSHTSSVGRPLSGVDMQSPVLPMPAAMFQDMRTQSAFTLQDFMLKQFNRADSSDVIIMFRIEHAPAFKIYGHGLVLSRSEKLYQLVSEQNGGGRTVYVDPLNHFMTEVGFTGALKYMYGGPRWIPENLFYEISQVSPDFAQNASPVHTMSHVLSYIASGHFLGLPEVVQAGIACAHRMQSWDTVSTCLAFSLDGGLDTKFWRIENAGDDANVLQEPTYGQTATYLLQQTLDWIAMAFPPVFHFAPTAAQLPELPRLPTIIENRPSQADPRLSLIQFGEMAPEEGKPDYLTLFLSSILVSLPFATLKFFFELTAFRSKPLDHLAIADAVIGEREDRRTKVLEAKRLKDGKNPLLKDATRWKEQVVHEPYLQLHRGFEGSSGA